MVYTNFLKSWQLPLISLAAHLYGNPYDNTGTMETSSCSSMAGKAGGPW